MKRMERLERAVGELQRQLLELGNAPSAHLDLTEMAPCDHEYVPVVIDRRNLDQCRKCKQLFENNVATFHKGHYYASGEQMPEEIEIE